MTCNVTKKVPSRRSVRYMILMMKHILFAVFALCALFAFLNVFHRADAQAPLRRLTTTGDVLEFAWSPRGDEVYVTREGEIFSLSAARHQITGDLYSVQVDDGASELLAQNANMTRPSVRGGELAFTRLNPNGTARAILFDPSTGQERDMGEITWGAVPQWNRVGDTLFFVRDGKMRRATNGQRGTVFDAQTYPANARTSPAGDRVAFVDNAGLWVTQGNSASVIATSGNGTEVLNQFVWSNTGEKLAYIVTHQGLDPEVWLADTATNSTARIAQGRGLEHFANLAWAPDDAFVIFTRTPTGSSGAHLSEIWRAKVDGAEARALTHNNAEETLPQYSPDGNSIAFLRGGDVWVTELKGDGLLLSGASGSNEIGHDSKTLRSVDTQRTPPATIRVRHDAANGCRSVPAGQIDTIDFEMYVKRVVPSEVFPSWDDDALKTQAVAARTYAWFWILQRGMSEYDVTDSTAYQYMCDTRYSSTDDATEATRGQYLDYQGFMVFAAYGAENGDPTLTNTFGNPYLIGVDDPVGFMKTRAGNGIGYSQWGAQRWASQYNWNYQQILLHYYTGVTVEAPAGAGNDVTSPSGAIVSPWSNWGITSNRVHFVLNASDDMSGVASIDLRAQYLFNGAHNEIIATLVGNDRDFLWDVSGLPNQTGIFVTPVFHDGNGNTSNGAGIAFDLDRKKPQGTLAAPATTTNQTIPLALQASDAGGSQLAGMMFSNDWEWQGENQSFEGNSASVVTDPDALNGSALRGLVPANPPGAWYGPYTNALPLDQPYRAYFRLKTDNASTTKELALLDVVVDGGAQVLGLKRVRGVDLKAANEYQEFYVDFYYEGFSTTAPEFRVAYRANASLWLDRILVTRYPIPFSTTTTWQLSDGVGAKRVIAKFADGAGNVSPDSSKTVFFDPNPHPALTPRAWLPFILRER